MVGFRQVWLGLGGFCDLILGEKFQKYALSNLGL